MKASEEYNLKANNIRGQPNVLSKNMNKHNIAPAQLIMQTQNNSRATTLPQLNNEAVMKS